MGPRRQPTAGFVNSEGMPIKKPSPRGDRITYILVGLLQLVAVALIVTQLKAIGLLPAWVDTDWTSVRTCLSKHDCSARQSSSETCVCVTLSASVARSGLQRNSDSNTPAGFRHLGIVRLPR